MSRHHERAQRGHQALGLHPDFHVNDFATSASDLIADVLHACADAGVMFEEGPAHPTPQDILDRALRTYEGDAEDEPADFPPGASA